MCPILMLSTVGAEDQTELLRLYKRCNHEISVADLQLLAELDQFSNGFPSVPFQLVLLVPVAKLTRNHKELRLITIELF